MITDKRIMHISLVLVIIGIIGLFIILQFIGPMEISTGMVTSNEIGENVAVGGVVESYFEKDGHVFMDIDDGSGVIKVIMFENTAKSYPIVYSITENDRVFVDGKVELYRNELELVANSINVV